MNWEKLFKCLVIYIGFCVFAFVCAVGIAEMEIIEQYRPLVYLGTACALAALAFILIFVFFFRLGRLQKRISKILDSDPSFGIERLCLLLKKTKNRSGVYLITQNLAYCYLKNGMTEKAKNSLELLRAKDVMYFNVKNQKELLQACFLFEDDFEGFKLVGKVIPRWGRWSFLEPKLIEKWKEWLQN